MPVARTRDPMGVRRRRDSAIPQFEAAVGSGQSPTLAHLQPSRGPFDLVGWRSGLPRSRGLESSVTTYGSSAVCAAMM